MQKKLTIDFGKAETHLTLSGCRLSDVIDIAKGIAESVDLIRVDETGVGVVLKDSLQGCGKAVIEGYLKR